MNQYENEDRRKSDRRIPPALAEFAVSQLAEAGELAAIDLTVQNVEIFRQEIVKRDARIANLERLLNNTSEIAQAVEQELTALKEQQRGGVVLPDGWVPLTIEYEPGYPEDVAFGPQRMMDRLKKWLDRYFAMRLNPPGECVAVPIPALEQAVTVLEWMSCRADICHKDMARLETSGRELRALLAQQGKETDQ